MKVLVVDDDASVRSALHQVLTDAGYDVILAADGQEALEQFASQPPDLLILDLGLPGQSGWETFERITSQNPVLPNIIITGQSDQYDMASAAGVGALMEKPLDAEALLETMQSLLAEPKETRLRRLCGYEGNVRHVQPRRRPSRRRFRQPDLPPYRYPRLHPVRGVSEY